MYNALEYLERSAEKYPDKVAFADVKKEITKALCTGVWRISSRVREPVDSRTPKMDSTKRRFSPSERSASQARMERSKNTLKPLLSSTFNKHPKHRL